MKPKGEKGREMVERIGHKTKTGGFNKIEKKAESEGKSKESAAKIAGAVYWKMARKHGMHGGGSVGSGPNFGGTGAYSAQSGGGGGAYPHIFLEQ